MPMPALLPLPALDAPGETYRVSFDKRVEGDPLQTLWLQHSAAGGGFVAGVWASEVGAWRVHYTEHEVCWMLEGVSELRSDSGEVLRVQAGDCFAMEPGFRGVWAVIEPTKKRFVIYEPQA